jgi:lipoprotein-anchoring transpeptidase ErfK/SrfK
VRHRSLLVVLVGAALAGGTLAALRATALAAVDPATCPAWVADPTAAPATTSPSTSTPSAPAVTPTVGTTLVGATSALVAATVTGAAGPVQVTVAYWQTGDAVTCASVQTVGTDAAKVSITGLLPATQYQFEVVANAGADTGASPAATLSTLPAGTVAQGVSAGPTLLGRLARSKARARLAKAANVPLRFGYHGALWQATPAQLGARFLVGRTLTAALAAQPGTTIARPAIRIDGTTLRRYVARLATRYDHAAAAASVRLVGSHAEVAAPKPGTVLERNTLIAAIQHELLHATRTRLQLPMRTNPALRSSQSKAVVVRLDTQTLTAYLNGRPVLTTPVTTGRPALPTPVGSFSVQFKASPYVFHSPWAPGSPYWYPPAPVTWAMEFYDGDFLHDDPAEPSNAFGSDSQNGYFASHGCVHVPHDAMAFLYGWLPVGAPVIVARD